MKDRSRKGMTRDEATKLYRELQNTMRKNPGAREHIKRAVKGDRIDPRMGRAVQMPGWVINGNSAAVALVIIFACAKIALSFMEFSGFASVQEARASFTAAPIGEAPHKPAGTPGQFTKEEVKVLSMLDSRRSELESRGSILDKREEELKGQEQELALRLNELRALTEKLKVDRQQDERKRTNQTDQLSKVYGSMNPEEAAQLMEQLDITIALALLQRMPEKRIGQILALMSPERALGITKMLSGAN